MSLFLVAFLAGMQATAPVAAAPTSPPSEVEGVVDNWDMENDTCGHHSVIVGDAIEAIDDVQFHVVNNQSEAPLSRIEMTSSRSSGDCDDSASAPAGWTAQLLLDGTAVFVAQTPEDEIERGQTRTGFSLHRRHGGDCCHRHRAYGPGVTIRDDDDNRDDCSCNNVSVAPASWSQAKTLYK